MNSMVPNPLHLSPSELEAGLDDIRRSPTDDGALELIVRRPKTDEREVLHEGQLDPAAGLVGDNWGNGRSLKVDTQLTIMNARAIALIAQKKDRWPLAGDQLFIDMELTDVNLPPGTQLVIGSALIEITSIPHNGCRKFSERFGPDALKFVNSPVGTQLHLRGIYAKVVQAGFIEIGDVVCKASSR